MKPSDVTTGCLKPNSTINMVKSGIQPPVSYQKDEGISNPTLYHVIFNGPNAGIYTNKNIVESYVKKMPGIKYASFNSFGAAQKEGRDYTTFNNLAPLTIIPPADLIEPRISFAQALSTRRNALKNMGNQS